MTKKEKLELKDKIGKMESSLYLATHHHKKGYAYDYNEMKKAYSALDDLKGMLLDKDGNWII